MSKRSLLALLLLLVAGVQAQSMNPEPKLAIEPQAGMSQLLGEGSDFVETGFGIGMTALSSPAKQAQLGLSFSYNRFGVNAEEMLADMGLQIPTGASIEETFTIVEATPVVRFSLLSPDQKFISFLQGGLGMYFTAAEAEASYNGRTSSNSQNPISSSGSTSQEASASSSTSEPGSSSPPPITSSSAMRKTMRDLRNSLPSVLCRPWRFELHALSTFGTRAFRSPVPARLKPCGDAGPAPRTAPSAMRRRRKPPWSSDRRPPRTGRNRLQQGLERIASGI